ncbi:hypothetical protein NL676_038055 [Syzygium grande]|nr:hypothetical protein NL676_038055 [Syzygium grande]
MEGRRRGGGPRAAVADLGKGSRGGAHLREPSPTWARAALAQASAVAKMGERGGAHSREPLPRLATVA